MDYPSTSNIREVIKFYNLGDQSFETDFSIPQVYFMHISIEIAGNVWQNQVVHELVYHKTSIILNQLPSNYPNQSIFCHAEK